MFIYELSTCGFESDCNHLESFTHPRVPHKSSEGGGTVFDIFDFWSCWVLFCIELIDLIPTSFFNKIVIVLLKMHAAGEIFVKICLKARNIFFPDMFFPTKGGVGRVSMKESDTPDFLVGRDMTEWWEVSKIWLCALLLPVTFLMVNPVLIY